MRKILIVMRHAKTETQQADQKDYDRNLLERGKNDAALMAERLVKAGFKPDIILSSSANRTEQTTGIVKTTAHFEEVKTRSLTQLYHASADQIEHEVMAVEDTVTTLMIVGHNPGISEFTWNCSPKSIVSEMPTSAIAVFSFEGASWQEFTSAKKKLELYDYPRK